MYKVVATLKVLLLVHTEIRGRDGKKKKTKQDVPLQPSGCDVLEFCYYINVLLLIFRYLSFVSSLYPGVYVYITVN